jgi:hypothetical protein
MPTDSNALQAAASFSDVSNSASSTQDTHDVSDSIQSTQDSQANRDDRSESETSDEGSNYVHVGVQHGEVEGGKELAVSSKSPAGPVSLAVPPRLQPNRTLSTLGPVEATPFTPLSAPPTPSRRATSLASSSSGNVYASFAVRSLSSFAVAPIPPFRGGLHSATPLGNSVYGASGAFDPVSTLPMPQAAETDSTIASDPATPALTEGDDVASKTDMEVDVRAGVDRAEWAIESGNKVEAKMSVKEVGEAGGRELLPGQDMDMTQC